MRLVTEMAENHAARMYDRLVAYAKAQGCAETDPDRVVQWIEAAIKSTVDSILLLRSKGK